MNIKDLSYLIGQLSGDFKVMVSTVTDDLDGPLRIDIKATSIEINTERMELIIRGESLEECFLKT